MTVASSFYPDLAKMREGPAGLMDEVVVTLPWEHVAVRERVDAGDVVAYAAAGLEDAVVWIEALYEAAKPALSYAVVDDARREADAHSVRIAPVEELVACCTWRGYAYT